MAKSGGAARPGVRDRPGMVLAAIAAAVAGFTAVVVLLLSDSAATVVLFVALAPVAVLASAGFGAFMIMLGDSGPRSPVSWAAIGAAVFGPFLGTLALQVTAVVVAGDLAGRTFYLPLVAVAASALWSVALAALAGWLVSVFG
ncbi:hypothetical protein ACOBQX_00845 [Actinokineospora sp. G85]|uniref:hypothetical protein n=1 Tax=Actinokineospora sp. G85 TaxID=3406626 RepID=UPI003C78FEE5